MAVAFSLGGIELRGRIAGRDTDLFEVVHENSRMAAVIDDVADDGDEFAMQDK